VSSQQAETRTETFSEVFESIATNVERIIQGKAELIRLVLLCLVAEGHLLIEDAPGVGKTSLAKAVARSIDVDMGRVQFTPDLLPSDVLGVTVWNRGTSAFEFRPGPIFNGIVLADEINRTSPKTQAALLESMAEGQVTIDGVTHPLERPFMVIATQNPLEHEGTYPLPDSQLDRFLMRVSMGYPGREAELEILETHGGDEALDRLQPVVSAANVKGLARAVQGVHIVPAIREYLVAFADATRRHPAVALGMSPRSTLALQRVSRARAAASGRDFVTPDDVKALVLPVLAHRLVLSPEAQVRGLGRTDVLSELLGAVPVPTNPT